MASGETKVARLPLALRDGKHSIILRSGDKTWETAES
jgi:hypothetical protein